MQKDDKTPKEETTGSPNASQEADNSAESQGNADETMSGARAAELEAKNAELNERYLRLYSEFDNYRKRTMREKADIIKTAAEDVFKAVLPVIDDFERAMKANETEENVETIKEGIRLIYNKLKNAVQQKGLQSFESIGENFNPDLMEAITHVPADDKNSGKVIDEVEKGYRLGEKVIRYAKVVVAQ
jgi:molecular chaperone GrpE